MSTDTQPISRIAVAQRPTGNGESEAVMKSYPRWVFSPGQPVFITGTMLVTSSVSEIQRAIPTMLVSKDYNHANHDDVYGGTHKNRRVKIGELVEDEANPYDQAQDMLVEFAKFGFVVLESLTKIEPDDVGKIMDCVLPEPKGIEDDRIVMPTLKQIRIFMSGPPPTDFEFLSKSLQKIAVTARKGLMSSCNLTWTWQNAYLNKMESEMEKARNGRDGKLEVDALEMIYYEQTERPIPRQKTLAYDQAKEQGEASLLGQLLDRLNVGAQKQEEEDDEPDVNDLKMVEMENRVQALAEQNEEYKQMIDNIDDVVAQKVAEAMAKVAKPKPKTE